MASAPTVRVLTSDVPPATGWDTVTLMAELLAGVLAAELIRVPTARATGRGVRLASLVPRRRGSDVTIVIAPDPGRLYDVLDTHHHLAGDGAVAGWVIDSFWTDRIPRVASPRHFDHLFVTDGELVDDWALATGVPTHFLPFGSDVLERGSAGGDRPVDLQRIGRQPTAWEDDGRTAAAAAAADLCFAGRTPFVPTADGNQRAVMEAMAGAKFTLSFSNVLSPAPYTHPTREYLTGRWTDALASGATVAGIPPRCAATTRLLWPEATLALPHDDVAGGLSVVRDHARTWSPDRARYNHAMALRRLDWRHRFRDLAATIGLESPGLQVACERLDRAIEATPA